MVPELEIPIDAPAKARIHKLATGVSEAREEMAKVQLELNLQIVELRLKAQRSTHPKVREQSASAITSRMEEISSVVRDCTRMLKESFQILTNLEEEPNILRYRQRRMSSSSSMIASKGPRRWWPSIRGSRECSRPKRLKSK